MSFLFVTTYVRNINMKFFIVFSLRKCVSFAMERDARRDIHARFSKFIHDVINCYSIVASNIRS